MARARTQTATPVAEAIAAVMVGGTIDQEAAKPFGDRELDYVVDAGDAVKYYVKGEQSYSKRRCLFRYANGKYAKHHGYGQSANSRESAAIMTADEWYSTTSWEHGSALEVLLDAPKEPPKPRADGTFSYLSDHFDESFIGLMTDSPNNPLIRGHLMKRLKQAPDASLDTFDKLKHWIEHTFPVPEAPASLKKGSSRPAAVRGPEIEIQFDVSDVETGTCQYSVSRSGIHTETVTLASIREMAEEGLSMEEIVDRIRDSANDNNNAEMEWDSDEEHSNYDARDNDDFSFLPVGGADRMWDSIENFIANQDSELADLIANN